MRRGGSVTALVYDERYKLHLTEDGHPECPARCDAAMSKLDAPPLDRCLLRLAPRPAEDADLLAVHSDEHLRIVQRAVESGQRMLPTSNTHISEQSLEVARLAAGGVLTAVDAVLNGTARNAFCVLRPGGHHAGVHRGGAFCVFNNVAVAARYAQRSHGIERVLIVDWDVHHGNGTQEIFYSDDSVLFFSTHQVNLYPHTGSAAERGNGAGMGFTINCPMRAGAGRAEVMGAFAKHLRPAADRFRPQLVLISAGFDAREGDPLGRLRLTDDDFAELTRLCMQVAKDHAEGRVVSVLEGGYDLQGLAQGVAAHVRALCELETGGSGGTA
jgi:acetoin utilization deacetylase AcuC-like enzyme